MKKLLIVVPAIILLAGCVPTRMAELNDIEGLTYGVGDFGAEVIESYTVNKNMSVSPDNLALCVTSSIDNSAVVLSDNANSFVGASGTYHQINNQHVVGGGNVIQQQGSAGIVANGKTSYTSRLLNFIIKYTLTIRQDGSNISYIFNNIQNAQQNTGYLNNNGFRRVLTDKWSASDADTIIKELDNEVAKINNCLTIY